MHFSSLFLLSLLFTPSFSAVLTDSSLLPTLIYDYIIVGGGTAGLVIANRLTQNSAITVLVLEAGVSDQGIIAAEAPFLGPSMTPDTPYDWNYTVVPQTGLGGRSFPYPRGRILGGTSSVNYMVHQYGSSEDWTRLSTVSGDPGWAWTNMQNYVPVHEKVVPPVDGHNTAGQYIPADHGTNGVLSTSLPGFSQPIDPLVIATTQQLTEFPYNQDTGGGSQSLLGIGWVQSSAGGGVRSSSSTSYLAAASGRSNLVVLLSATVTKVLPTGFTLSGLTSFRAVQFSMTNAQGVPTGSAKIVTARKEVIISAGTINTPHLLQLSGIGNSADLAALHISTIISNPSVGANLTDHTLLPNIFSVQGTQSFDSLLRSPTQVATTLTQWISTKTGLFANNVVNNLGFARLPSTAPIFQTSADPSAGPNSPHWEMIFVNFWLNPGVATPATGSFLTIVTSLVSPSSRGSVKLASSNPFTAPLIDLNALNTAFDIAAMIDSVNAISRLVAAPAWSNYVIGRFGTAFQNAVDDASTTTYIRGLASSLFHPVGTSSMSSTTASFGVVNSDLKVKGTDGLRIIDASIFPFIPSCHIQGLVYLMAERAACLLTSTTPATC